MVVGGEATPPPHPTSSDVSLDLSYSRENFQLFEDRMGEARWRQNMLSYAVSDGDLGGKIGQNIARLIEGGKKFEEAVLQVGAKWAARSPGAPVNRDVMEWVKEVMFPIWDDKGVGLAASSHGGASAHAGRRSGAGGEMRSKQIKIEAMAILEHGDKAASSPSRGSASSPCVNPAVTGECTLLVCENASERVIADSGICGSNNADSLNLVVLGQDVKNLYSDGSGDLSKLRSLEVLVEEPDGASNPVELYENPVVLMDSRSRPVGEPVGGISEEQDQHCVDSLSAINGSSLTACGNAHKTLSVAPGGNGSVLQANCSIPSLKSGVPAALGVPDDRAIPGAVVAHGALKKNLDRTPSGSSDPMIGGVAAVAPSPIIAGDLGAATSGDKAWGNPSLAPSAEAGPHGLLAELSLAHEFRPPKPGVVLQEWVMVAKDKRKGKKSGAIHAVVSGEQRSIAAAPLAFADPFPPLTKSLGSNVGLAGSSSAADGLLGGIKNGNQNQEGEVNNFSWSDLLRSRKPTSVGVDLHFVEPTIIDGESCAVFSVEEEAENMLNWQHTLLCYVVGKSPSYYQFVKTVQRLWKCTSVEVFMRENGLFYCRFASEEDLCRVIKDGPWYMEGKLIVVKKFGGDTNCEEEMLSCIPIWVKLPCLPVKWWSISGVSKVVSPIGHPLYFDIPSASQSRIAFARCCVEVAMEKPLPDFVTCIGGDKVRRRQKILYDWVPKKCSRCMAFGHLGVDCHEEKKQEMPKVQKGVSQGNVRKEGQHSGVPKSNVQKSDLGSIKENAKELMPMQIIAEHGGCAMSKSAIADNGLIVVASPHCSDDDVAPSSVGASQHLVSGDEGDTDNGGERSEWDRMSCHSLEDPIGGGDEVGLSILPCNKVVEGVEGNEIGKPMNQEDDEAEMINYKKAKRTRKRPAPVRPAGSRTTRHSGFVPIT